MCWSLPADMFFVSLNFSDLPSTVLWTSGPRVMYWVFFQKSFVSCLNLCYLFSPMLLLPSTFSSLTSWHFCFRPSAGPSAHFLTVSPSLASLDLLVGHFELVVPVVLFPVPCSLFLLPCPATPPLPLTLGRCYGKHVCSKRLNWWMPLQIYGLS